MSLTKICDIYEAIIKVIKVMTTFWRRLARNYYILKKATDSNFVSTDLKIETVGLSRKVIKFLPVDAK